MSIISEVAAQKFIAGEKWSQDNTTVAVTEDNDGYPYVVMFLHGSAIANHRHEKQVFISLQGYNTFTTRGRLNAILEVMECKQRIKMVKGLLRIVGIDDDKARKLPMSENKFYYINHYEKELIECGYTGN